MKREINCVDCAKRWMGNDYPGEFKKYIHGKARSDYRCDGCFAEIKEGQDCVAFSLYTDRTSYYEWEGGYIATTREAK